jgi:hypothetical protein
VRPRAASLVQLSLGFSSAPVNRCQRPNTSPICLTRFWIFLDSPRAKLSLTKQREGEPVKAGNFNTAKRRFSEESQLEVL